MPFINQLRVDKLMGEISVRYRPAKFVASEIFPILPVKLDSGRYRIYQRNFRIPETLRADKAEAREFSFEASTATYVLEHHGLKDYISDRQRDNFEMADLRADTTEHLTDRILSRVEQSVSNLFTTTNWSLNVSLAAANAWTANTTVSNPIPIVDTASTTVILNSGMQPNYGVFNRTTFVAVKNHLSVLDRTKYVTSEMTINIMKGLFDLPQLLVSLTQVDTSELGETEAISALWGASMFVGWKPARPSPLAPSAGYLFEKSRALVKRWRDETRESEAIEVNKSYTPRVVASLAGYLINGVT